MASSIYARESLHERGIRRYLSPEPALQDQRSVKYAAAQGQSVPTYAYGFNNPVRNTDATGLGPARWPGATPYSPADSTYGCDIKQHPYEPEKCGAEPNREDPVVRCTRIALAAFEICIASGKDNEICLEAMNKVYKYCMKKIAPLACSADGPAPLPQPLPPGAPYPLTR